MQKNKEIKNVPKCIASYKSQFILNTRAMCTSASIPSIKYLFMVQKN